jgi:peptidoglycan/LPS O-acetylase OafA/YrhL
LTVTAGPEPAAGRRPGDTVTPTVHGVPSHQRFPCFDGLRAIAASSVLAYHIQGAAGLVGSERFGSAVYQPTIVRFLGTFGVAVFFVISGFLLYRPYALAHLGQQPTPRLGPFWKRRFARIYPAYWAALVAALLLGIPPTHTFTDLAMAFPLLQNYRSGYAGYGVSVEWTLVIEISFYLALPLIAYLIARASKRASKQGTLSVEIVALATLSALSIAAWIWRLGLYSGAPSRGTWFALPDVQYWLICYLDWFAVGMLLAVLSAWVAAGRTLPWPVAALARWPAVCWLLAAELYWVGTRFAVPPTVLNTPSLVEGVGSHVTFGLVAGLFVLPAALGDQRRGSVRAFLASRPLVALGVVSYGIYLWHAIWVQQGLTWGRSGTFPSSIASWILLVLPLTLACATASYWLVERPAIRWSHRTGGTPKTSAGTPAPSEASATGPPRR